MALRIVSDLHTKKHVLAGLLAVITCWFIPFHSTVSLAQVSFQTLESTGHGVTVEQAIDRALVGAITQVNGAAVASRARSSLTASATIDFGVKSSSSQKRFEETIEKTSKGIVKNYEILSQGNLPNSSLVSVKLSVTVADYEQSVQLKRLRLAVVPFRIQEFNSKHNSSKIFEDYMRRGLENYVTQTRRFAVIDRSFIEEQNKELDFIAGKEGSANSAGGASVEELARFGNRVGTDYLITGVVEKARSGVKTFTMKSTGQVIETPQIEARVTYRIIDVASSQVKFAATQKLYREEGDLETTADIISKQIGEKILNAIFPIHVLGINGSNVTLGQGGDTVKANAIYSLVRLGNEMFDPYTKETLGQEETIVGSVQVTDTQSKLSTAVIIDLKIPPDDLMKDDFIVRPRKVSSKNSTGQKAKVMKDTEKDFEKDFEKEFEKEFGKNN